MPLLYFSCLQLFKALTLDKKRSEMRALRHLESSSSKPYVILLRSHQQMIDRTSSWCMWLSSLHRHPNHMLSYLDRISRWLIAPADDACEWVTFIVIRTVCYLIETPADDWSHPAHYSCERVTFFVSNHRPCSPYLFNNNEINEIAPADDWSHLQMVHVSE